MSWEMFHKGWRENKLGKNNSSSCGSIPDLEGNYKGDEGGMTRRVARYVGLTALIGRVGWGACGIINGTPTTLSNVIESLSRDDLDGGGGGKPGTPSTWSLPQSGAQ